MNTRERILKAATVIFRRKGYEGAGLAEILKESAATKGSLYHHFPAGKTDLAAAAAQEAGAQMRAFIDHCFTETDDWRAAVTTMCFRLAKQFELADATEGCPVAAVLLDGPPDPVRRALAQEIYLSWQKSAANHLNRLGASKDAAKGGGKDGDKYTEEFAETVITMLQGAWIMARAAGHADPIRAIPKRLPPPFQG